MVIRGSYVFTSFTFAGCFPADRGNQGIIVVSSDRIKFRLLYCLEKLKTRLVPCGLIC